MRFPFFWLPPGFPRPEQEPGLSLIHIYAAKSALHKVGQVVLEGHINHCVRDGIEHGDAEQTIKSFTKAVERFANMK